MTIEVVPRFCLHWKHCLEKFAQTKKSMIKRTGNIKMTKEATKQELAVYNNQQARDVH